MYGDDQRLNEINLVNGAPAPPVGQARRTRHGVVVKTSACVLTLVLAINVLIAGVFALPLRGLRILTQNWWFELLGIALWSVFIAFGVLLTALMRGRIVYFRDQRTYQVSSKGSRMVRPGRYPYPDDLRVSLRLKTFVAGKRAMPVIELISSEPETRLTIEVLPTMYFDGSPESRWTERAKWWGDQFGVPVEDLIDESQA